MISARRIITILGTLFCAVGTGFFMQHYMQTPDRSAPGGSVRVASASAIQDVVPLVEQALKAPVEEEEQVQLEDIALTAAIPVPPSAAPQPELLPDNPVTLAALEDEPITDLPTEEPAPSFGCDIGFEAQAVAAAMVKLTLNAPCLANERFTLHHNGMMFADATDAEGHAEISVPALNKAAIFIATFTSGASAVANTEVGTLEYYDRAVVQWSGPEGLQIHALEYEAGYEADGHVWAGAARDLAIAAKGEGGFITRLGDAEAFNPMMAEIYTFPSGTALKEGVIMINLEAEVTEDNCNTDIEAQILQKSGTDRMAAKELVLAMPECDAVGDYLVLKNLFDDLNIARN